LADKELGQMRRAMETSGQWDKTWLIVSADHSLGSALIDRLDTRVPFIVKPPGANEPLTYSPKFNTIVTHDLILAILRGEIASQRELAPWLDKHGKPLPTTSVRGDNNNN
jgi:arylsulfatase A-like enzyme